jgi:hypothetical protein
MARLLHQGHDGNANPEREWILVSAAELRTLKTLASRKESTEEFCRFAQKLLVADFDKTYGYIKLQKILMKSRDQAAVEVLSANFRRWVSTAPISGKRRATLKRHLEVCLRVQELYSAIRRAADELTIWNCGRHELALRVLDVVEQSYNTTLRQGRSRNWEGLDPWQVLDSSRALTGYLRASCDLALLILAEIALRCPLEGDRFNHAEDLKRAFELASLSDELSLVFDHYTYHRWRATTDDTAITFLPAFDQYDHARQWCAQRVEASIPGFRQFVTEQEYEIKKRVQSLSFFKASEKDFNTFLLSESGHALRREMRPLKEGHLSFISHRVSEVFDLATDMEMKSGTFRVSELLSGWAAVWELSLCARMWNDICSKERDPEDSGFGWVPILQLDILDEFLQAEANFSKSTCANFRNQLTADLSTPSTLDLFYRPFLTLTSNQLAFAISYAETSRIDRNIFEIALRESDMDVSERGFKPLAKVRESLARNKFSSSTNFPLLCGGAIATDADLLAYKDDHLFVAQVKIVIEADSSYETWQVEQKLKTAASQLSRTLFQMSQPQNAERVAFKLGLARPAAFKIVVPFLLTNDWHFTGVRINGFSVIDLSYLDLILNEGEILVGTMNQLKKIRFLRGEIPTAAELRELIEEPLHRAMFKKPQVYFVKRSVGELSYSIPVTAVPGIKDAAERGT